MSNRLTYKQMNCLVVIARGNPGMGETWAQFADLDEILERIDYKTSKDSLQFTLRALIGRRLIRKVGMECRRGRQRVLFELTELGRTLIAAPPAADTEGLDRSAGEVALATDAEEVSLPDHDIEKLI